MDRIFYSNEEFAKASEMSLKRVDLNSQADYDALTSAQKNDGTKLYFIDVPEHDYLYKWDFTKSLIDEIVGETAELKASTFVEGTGIVFDGQYDQIVLGSPAAVGRTIEIDIRSFNKKFTGNGRLLMHNADSGLVYRKATGQWEVYDRAWKSYTVTNSDPSIFDGKTLKAIFTNHHLKVYADSLLVYEGYGWCSGGERELTKVGSWDGYSFYDMIVTGCRIYENEEEEN